MLYCKTNVKNDDMFEWWNDGKAEMAGMAANGYKWLEMAVNGCKWLKMAGKG